MSKKFILINLIFTLVFSLKANAQTTDNQFWSLLSAQGMISEEKKIGFYFEVQPRYSFDNQETFETLLRPAFFYKTESRGSFFIGYLQRFNSDVDQIELRYWTQWSNRYEFENYEMALRFRLENRDLNLSNESERLRFLLRLVKNDIKLFDFNPFAFHEYFHNLNSVGANIRSGFQQFRTVIGLNRRIEKTTLDIGILKNYINVPNRQNQDNTGVYLGILYSL